MARMASLELGLTEKQVAIIDILLYFIKLKSLSLSVVSHCSAGGDLVQHKLGAVAEEDTADELKESRSCCVESATEDQYQERGNSPAKENRLQRGGFHAGRLRGRGRGLPEQDGKPAGGKCHGGGEGVG